MNLQITLEVFNHYQGQIKEILKAEKEIEKTTPINDFV